jgi:hypothetical protein
MRHDERRRNPDRSWSAGVACLSGWSILLLAPLCALIAALLAGQPLRANCTQTFMSNAAGFVAQFFADLSPGALFGKLMEASGSVEAIAKYLTERQGTKRAMLESFNGRMRDEPLNETLFFELDDARAKIANWVADYNLQRPHSSLRYLTPAAYAAHLTATDDRLRNPDQLRRSSVAPTAPLGVQNPETLTAAG